MTENYLGYIASMLKASKPYSDNIIEATVIVYFCRCHNCTFVYAEEFAGYAECVNDELLKAYVDISPPASIEFLIQFFEALLKKDSVIENGIVFTPKYIADYICSRTMCERPPILSNESVKAIDPGCGCGIFLVAAVEQLHQQLKCKRVDIINNCIYGIDIEADNVRRCRMILNLLVAIKGESNANLRPNIICADSLKINWGTVFSVNSFDYVIGNPPYVNTHDMSKETAFYLKKTFSTTQNGVYNIFYAFIEYAMDFLNESGKLGYIIPNNFLTIKSAERLRKFIADYRYLECIIDFADNMVFRPVRTYNCIIQLSKNPCDEFKYCVLNRTNDIESALNTIIFDKMETSKLDFNGWKLVDKTTLSNLRKIEGQAHSIRHLIRTGIATLRDDVYIVDYDGVDFYKVLNGVKYIIESTFIKKLYKIPDLKNTTNINNKCRYIIFPYKKGKNGYTILDETEFKTSAPLTYQYLLVQKSELDERDKGKGNAVAWYAYGRTQGLNKYGMKLLFPTFSNHPRFTVIEDEYALFCNGYAVFESDYMSLRLLARILNSKVMYYYVSNTSYAIEGGYFCYQKKYIERFSIPMFSAEEMLLMESMDELELDKFLFQKYNLIA